MKTESSKLTLSAARHLYTQGGPEDLVHWTNEDLIPSPILILGPAHQR